MHQVSLFDHFDRQPKNRAFDSESERLLKIFAEKRSADGAHPRSVKREVSQLRSLAGELQVESDLISLTVLFRDLRLLAQALCEPRSSIARSTGRVRYVAARRFMEFVAPLLGRDARRDLLTLDSYLPAGRRTAWHSTGIVVAGAPSRRSRRAVSLDWSHLIQLVDTASTAETSVQTIRNVALVALHCFSGLRPEEIVLLQWKDIATDYSPFDDRHHFKVRVKRAGRDLWLPLVSPAVKAITSLATSFAWRSDPRSGPLFESRNGVGRPLGYRAVRMILKEVCRRAGLPAVEAIDLRAAFAYGLRMRGLSDHEVAAVLGLAQVRSLDRLLRRHMALDAQRKVREILDL